MISKHIEQVRDERRAVAPYNFVELPEKVVPAEPLPAKNWYYTEHKDSEGKAIRINRHTGQIHCTLTTSSPLYIRCGMSPSDFANFDGKSDEELKEQQEEKRLALAPFFENPANHHPTIPGSSLRGMLRTLVEIVSHSKMDKVSDQQLIYRAFADTTSLGSFYRDRLIKTEAGHHKYSFLMQAGYIVQTQQGSGWAIVPAKHIVEGASFARIEKSQIEQLVKRNWYDIQHARQVTVHVEPIAWHPHRGGHIELYYAKATPPFGYSDKSWGVLVETGGMPGKKKMECVVGLPDDLATPIPIPDYPDSMIQDYKDQLTKEQKKLLGKDGVLKHMHPVFYLKEKGELVFWGHTMMFRLPYKQSIKKFLPEPNYKFISNNLYNSPTLDIAEAIFGFARDKKQKKDQTQAGRVFVSDAKCQRTADEDIWLSGDIEKAITPKILSSPKPTTFQHYLVQDSDQLAELKHYASSTETTVIRGHKLYWHKGSVERNQIEEIDKKRIKDFSSQYTDIKPIKENVCFNFTIWFENLSDIELGALLWILKLASEKDYRLSLGMGKPLGMGAVQISYQLFLSNRQKRYTQLFQDSKWSSDAYSHDYINETLNKCLQEFENYVLKHTEAKVRRLQDVPRIKTLLTMLLWTGVSEKSSRYMEIERKQQPCIGNLRKGDKGTNEYDKRPVLPTPSQVMRDDRKRNYPGAPSPSASGGSNPAAWQRL